MATTYRLFNDRGEIESIQFNDRVVSKYFYTADGKHVIDGIDNGVNRINFYCPEAGSYKAKMMQYIGKMEADGTILIGTANLSNQSNANMFTNTLLGVTTSSVSILSFPTIDSFYNLAQVNTSSGTVLQIKTANMSTNDLVYYFRNWTTPYLIASIPLVPAYNDSVSYGNRLIILEFSGIGSAPVEVHLTTEASRTAIAS